jgi:flavin-binding protein dodecin
MGGIVDAKGVRTRSRISMVEHVYSVTELVGSSPDGVDAAIQVGIDRAASTLRGLDWFEVTEIRGHIVDGRVAHYQVGLKIGFRLESPE